jgi:hypothetical protein
LKDAPSQYSRWIGNFSAKVFFLSSLLPIIACSQSQPLSVTMVHPETKAVAKCAARQAEKPKVAAEVLSNAVETCVKQLEARGFKRAD